MLTSLLPISLLVLLVHAANLRSTVDVPLIRANQLRKTPEQKAQWARKQGERLISKYLPNNSPSSSIRKRAATTGTNDLVNHNQDSSYFGSLAIGSPPIAFNVILDTGSADFWIAANSCRTGCSNIPTFSPSGSSTFKNLSAPFNIQYGSGAARGWLATDTVQMAGFSVQTQKFAIVSAVSQNLLTNPVSGLLGLGFQTISSSGALPFWQALAESNVWEQPVMSFYLTRFINASHAESQEPGGRFTLGFADPALHSGDIQFTPIPAGQQGYWILPLESLTVNSQNVSLTNPNPSTGAIPNNMAAIDTGTTLIGGPPSTIAALFSLIPGSAAATGDFDGYYTYPCSTEVSVTLSFGEGGQIWSINPDDFMLTQLSSQQCIGAFFAVDMGNAGPGWIVGDTFLKNVYSVFRFNPPAVGFAELSLSALDLAVAGGPLPSLTIGANPTVATGRSAASIRWSISLPLVFMSVIIVLSML